MRNTSLALFVVALVTSSPIAWGQQDTARDAELEQAREQLEDAARRIAELTQGAIGPGYDFFRQGRAAAPRAVLGVAIDDDERGVRVVGVTPGSGADAAGVETGDVITAMDGASLDSGADRSPSELLIAQMNNVAPGDTVTLTVLRDGEARDLAIEATAPRWRGRAYAGPGAVPGARLGPTFRGGGGPFDFTAPIRRWADMELVELSPGLGAYFGTEDGVLVVRAPRDETLGLEDGDVILEIGGREPTDVGHALRILASFNPGEQLQLTVMREQRRRTLEIELPGPDDRD